MSQSSVADRRDSRKSKAALIAELRVLRKRLLQNSKANQRLARTNSDALDQISKILSGALGNAGILLSIKDDRGRYRSVNRSYASVFGLKAGAFVGKTDRAILPRKAGDLISKHDRMVREGKGAKRFVETLPGRKGPRTFITTRFALGPSGAAPIGTCAIGVEVSDYQRETENLTRMLRLHEDAYNHTPAMQHSINEKGNIVAVSGFWLKSMGYQREEVMGRPIVDFQTRASAKIAQRDIPRSFVASGRMNLSRQFVTKQGNILEVLLSVITTKAVAGDGKRQFSVLSDVTELKNVEGALKRSEKRFKAYAEIASDAIWDMDAELRFTRFGGTTFLISADQEKSIGKTRWELAGIDPDKDPHWGAHRKVQLAREPFNHFEYSGIGLDGTVRRVLTSGRPIFDDDGKFCGYFGVAFDDTDRWRREQALRESEAKFRDYAGMATDIFWEMDANLRYTNVVSNRTLMVSDAADLVGMTRWEVLGIDPNDNPKFKEHQRALEDRESFSNFEYTAVDADGNVQRLTVRGRPLFDDQGSFLGYRGVSSFITDRWKHEQELRASEQRFKAFAEIASDGYWETDIEHKFKRLPGGASITEVVYDRRKFIGKTRWEHAKGNPKTDLIWINHIVLLEAHKAFRNFEYNTMNPSGELRRISSSGRPIFDDDNNFVGYRGVASDITERWRNEQALRVSEERFRTFVDNSPAKIHIKDHDGRFTLLNRQAERVFGLAKEKMIGRTSEEIVEINVFREFVEHDLAVARSGKAIEREEVFELEDGKHTFLTVKFPILEADGKSFAIGAIGTDISERIELEEQLAHAQKMDAFGQLTGGIAHDFNNLLAIIQGNLELALEDLPPESGIRRRLDQAFGAAERGARLNQDLLAFARRTALQPRVIDVNGLIVGMSEMLGRTLGETVDIEVITTPRLWFSEADPGQVQNAVLNLAINARDAMPKGGKLTIETANARLNDEYADARAEVKAGEYVMIAVTDTGTGMDAETVSRAFEPFFTTKSVGKGTGLGLSMVYGFAKQSNGHATIYSEPGEGTAVKIYLPKSAQSPIASETPRKSKALPMASGEVVLVVEDDADVRNLVVALLTSLQYDVLEASDANKALTLLRQSHLQVDLLLTDVVLPGGTGGPQLAEIALDIRPHLNVLYMSGYTENAAIHHGRLDDGVLLLQKPFRKADLARKVRQALGRPDGQKE